jgi:hypothetical protein
MGVVMITCPNTGRAVSTGIETDARSLASLSLSLTSLSSRNALFAAAHVWWKREAWIAVDGGGDLSPPVGRQRRKRGKAAR